MNPLLSPSPLPFQLPDYARLTTDHVREAALAAMAEQREAVEALVTDPSPATVENVLVALELSGRPLARVINTYWVVVAADGTDERRAVEAELAPLLATHSDAVRLDPRLHRRLVALRDRATAGEVTLDAEDEFHLGDLIDTLERSGVNLAPKALARLKELNTELASLSVEFERRLLDERGAKAVLVTEREELDGLDEAQLETAHRAALDRGLEGWLIELTNTTRQPILADLRNRDLRRRILQASMSRGLEGDHDVRRIVLDIAHRRAERAQLLGHPHHASWVAAEGCARTTPAVLDLLQKVAPGAMALAQQEASELQDLLQRDVPGATLEPWDWEFYAAEQAAAGAVDPAQLKPYLEFERVLHHGVFAAATGLYGITFHERPDLVGFTPEARVHEVREADGSPLGAFVIDPFTRPTKRGGAWMTSIVDQAGLTSDLPVVTNTCNYTPPAEGAPALLSWDNVITLFHEFGHALHGLLSDVKYPSRSGTSVPRDFVEFPSQVNEMWAWDENLIRSFARHHVTDEPLPEELVARLRASRAQGEGFQTLETVAAMLLDQAWHTATPEELPRDVSEVEAFEQAALERAGVAHPLVPPRYRTCYFSHVFGSAYAAAYYGYLWAEVMDADTVAWFEEQGGLRREAGEWFRRELLGRGGSIEPMRSWHGFRGGDPDVSHLLARKGLRS
ncbi:M3 family metallopeptidase [Arachnia propionica]|nr:M3 family metallopeptidase [Arachnia propionica]MDO5083105.1 M3 family metallopeptidase [Arachnia propionica]